MSSKSTKAKEAMETSRATAEQYYGIALPALSLRFGEINKSLAGGEPAYLSSAFTGARGAMTEAMSGKADVAAAQQAAGSKAALSGGNAWGSIYPADLGAQLANALYGSRFAEGQANIEQQFNLMGMALGAGGTAGSSALGSAQQQLGAIQYMAPVNSIYSSVVGGLAGLGSAYGAYNNQQMMNTWNALTPYAQTWGMPTATNYPGTVATGAPGMGG